MTTRDGGEVVAASINAAFKCWYVNSGEYTADGDGSHWGAFWEPLQVNLPSSAKPSCCYGSCIAFYDRNGNQLLKDYVRHYDFINAHPHLLFLADQWREVVNGRVEFRDGRWYMRWGVATNTQFARMLNDSAMLSRRASGQGGNDGNE